MPYPAHREVDVPLRDGTSLHLRPVAPADEPALEAFLAGAVAAVARVPLLLRRRSMGSPPSRPRTSTTPTATASSPSRGDGARDPRPRHVRPHRPEEAEVAFAVADALQGEGIATTMLAHLAQAAEEQGIERFVARVLPDNHRDARGVPRERPRSRPSARSRARSSSPCRPSSASAPGRYDERDAIAAAAAVEHVLRPRSVAVVGASRPRGLGRRRGPRQHPRRAASPARCTSSTARADEVHGAPGARAVADVPGDVDLAVVATPARRGRRHGARLRGARASMRSSSSPPASARPARRGARASASWSHVCRAGGHAPGRPELPRRAQHRPGGAAERDASRPARRRPAASRFLSQSGALGHRASWTRRASEGLGLSSFVSVGDKADLSGNDFLELLGARRPAPTSSCSTSSRSATRASSRASPAGSRARKPIVAVKGGRSPAGRARRPARTPARCWPPRTRPSTRCSRRPASCARTRSASCSTSPRCWTPSRRPRAAASASSRTAAAWGSSAPTRARPPGWTSSRRPPRPRERARSRGSAAAPRWATRSTCSRRRRPSSSPPRSSARPPAARSTRSSCSTSRRSSPTPRRSPPRSASAAGAHRRAGRGGVHHARAARRAGGRRCRASASPRTPPARSGARPATASGAPRPPGSVPELDGRRRRRRGDRSRGRWSAGRAGSSPPRPRRCWTATASRRPRSELVAGRRRRRRGRRPVAPVPSR